MKLVVVLLHLLTSFALFASSFIQHIPFGSVRGAGRTHVLWDGGASSVIDRCRQKICTALDIPLEKCVIQSADDDPNGTHIYVECVSDKFAGKRSMQRQQMIYKALWDEMKDGAAVHAVDGMVLKTPDELVEERGY